MFSKSLVERRFAVPVQLICKYNKNVCNPKFLRENIFQYLEKNNFEC